MSRMTDERLAEYVEAANRVPAERHGVMERLVYALKAERAKVAELRIELEKLRGQRDTARGTADHNEQGAKGWIEIAKRRLERAEAAEARVAELEAWKADRIKTFEEWKANIDRADNLVQKIIESELEAAEAQLAALREENLYLKEIYIDLGLHDSACRIDTDGECDCWHERFADELQSLLTQTEQKP